MSHNLNVIIFCAGWLLYVLAQAQNSVASITNGLRGSAGWIAYFKAHGVNLATRAFFSGLAYRFIIDTVAKKIQSVGFPVTSTTIAGLGGYSANALLYQFFGFIPWLRVEMGALAPPPPPPATK